MYAVGCEKQYNISLYAGNARGFKDYISYIKLAAIKGKKKCVPYINKRK